MLESTSNQLLNNHCPISFMELQLSEIESKPNGIFQFFFYFCARFKKQINEFKERDRKKKNICHC